MGSKQNLHLRRRIVIYLWFLMGSHKHPIKIHEQTKNMGGRTGICIFDGNMNAEAYTAILRETL